MDKMMGKFEECEKETEKVKQTSTKTWDILAKTWPKTAE